MSDAQLNVLNYALLALIYLFFARVLWAVWSEVRGPRPGQPTPAQQARAAGATGRPDATAVAPRPTAPGTAGAGPNPADLAAAPPKGRGKRGVPTRLVVLQPRVRKGAAYPIGGEITLGRAPTCSIGLPDDTFASQLHARVFVHQGAVVAEDLGSTNGTHVNGARISSATALAQGDRLQVGNTIFEAQ